MTHFATDRLALGLAVVGAVAGLASQTINIALSQAVSESPRNAATAALYPWTVRLDLLVLLVLGLAVVLLALWRPGSEGCPFPRAWLGVPALSLGLVAAWRSTRFDGLLLLLSGAAAVWLGFRLAGGADRRAWWPLGVAFLVRAAAALALAAYGQSALGQSVVLDDEASYDFAARQVARILATGSGDLDLEWRHLSGHHLDLLGFLYWAREPDFTSLRILDAGLGTLAVGLLLGIGRSLWPQPAAYAATWLTVLWPLNIVWSGTGLRESLSLVTVLLLLWLGVAQPWRGRSRGHLALTLVTAGLAALVLGGARPESATALALAACLVLLVPLLARVDRARLLALLGIAALAAAGALAGLLGQPLSPRAIEYRAAISQLTPLIEHERTKLPPKPSPDLMNMGTLLRAIPPGREGPETVIISGYEQDPLAYRVLTADGTSFIVLPADARRLSDENVQWQDVLGRLADGARLLFVPDFRSDALAARRLALTPDTLGWDALFILSLIAAWRTRRDLTPGRALLYAYPWLIILGLVATSTNLGTLARHRSTLEPWLALASAPILAMLGRRAQQWRRPGQTAAPEPVRPGHPLGRLGSSQG
jgi:hypothetical protein